MNLKEYQYRVEDTWLHNEHDKERIILGVVGECGEIAEKFKKNYRGDFEGNHGQDIFKAEIKKELGDLTYYIAKLCTLLNLSWEEILEENINKLAKRKQENKIKGSGDNR